MLGKSIRIKTVRRLAGRAALAFLSAALLASCQTPRPPEPIIRTVEVRIPTPVPCVPPNTPEHQPTRAWLPEEVGALVQAITAELIERRRYDDSAEVVIAACRRVGG